MSNHTPGPWEMLPPTGWATTYIAIRSTDSKRFREKVAVVESSISEETAKANAQLVASAPEMLEALRVAEYALFCCDIDWSELTDNQHGAFPGLKALNQVRKAIAKATGEKDE